MYFCEALELAMDLEKESVEHYQEALQRINDKFAKKALEFLIKEEREHIDKIERFNKSLMGNEKFDVKNECASDLKQRISSFVKSTVDASLGRLGAVDSDIEVYEKAMEFEKRGYEVYKSYREKEEDERVKKFLEFLIGEEEQHYELLLQSKKYLEDPSYYFEDAGGWIFG